MENNIQQQRSSSGIFAQMVEADLNELNVVVERSESVLSYLESRFVRGTRIVDVDAYEQLVIASEIISKLQSKKKHSALFLASETVQTGSLGDSIKRSLQLPVVAKNLFVNQTKRSRRALEQIFSELEAKIPTRSVRLPVPKLP